MPEGGVIALDSAYGGRIARVEVEDESHVRAGDVIAVLENTEVALDAEECRYNLEVLRVQREMYGGIYEHLV